MKELTPKEKAQELFNWFIKDGIYSFSRYQSTDIEDKEGAIYCSIKQVDEIIKALIYPPNPNENRQVVHINTIKYWKEVKNELQLLGEYYINEFRESLKQPKKD
jgi:hypothetical protein